MGDNLRELAKHLREASTLLDSVLDSRRDDGNTNNNQPTTVSTSSVRSTSTRQQPSDRPGSGIGLSAAIGSQIGSAVSCARLMVTSSASQGTYSRLGLRERLRATPRTEPAHNQPTKNERKRRKYLSKRRSSLF